MLKAVNKIEQIERIRFISPHPKDFTDDVIEAIATCDKVCKLVHLPLQSGSTNVLKAMNRKYDMQYFINKINQIRSIRKDIAITSDVIVGFPGETEEQFQNTLKAMSELELDYSNTAAYSPREKTVAAKWVDLYIPEDVKTERLARLNEHNRLCCLKSNQKYVGREMEVLIEKKEIRNGKGVITGRTRNNKIVHNSL